MKKIIYYSLLVLLTTTSMVSSSCQKNGTKPKKTVSGPAVGYWYGHFSNNNGLGADLGILFRSDGTLKVYDFFGAASQTDTTKTTLVAAGSYTVTGNNVNFSYTFSNESFTARGTLNTSSSPASLPFTFTDPNSVPLSGTATVSQQSN